MMPKRILQTGLQDDLGKIGQVDRFRNGVAAAGDYLLTGSDEIVSFYQHGRPPSKAYNEIEANLAAGVARCPQ